MTSGDLSALLNYLTILHLLRTSPHHFKSHHYHQDPYFMFVMTTILFLTAGGCQAFIHTLVHLDCGFRLGSFFLLKPVTMGRTEGPAPFWQYWSQVALYFCWKASWELFQRSEFTKVCMKTSKYLLKLQTQNLCHSKSMNISVILVAFSLFWETIQNKESKGCLSTICEWFSCNLRYPFNFLNISTAPASCHRSDFPLPFLSWRETLSTSTMPAEQTATTSGHSSVCRASNQTVENDWFADFEGRFAWIPSFDQKCLQTMTLVALKMSSWKQLDPSFLWMRMLKHYKALIHSYGTGVKVEISIPKPYSISQLGKHFTQPLVVWDSLAVVNGPWLWPN